MQVRIVGVWISHVENWDRHDEDEVAEADHHDRPSHLQVASVHLTTILVAERFDKNVLVLIGMNKFNY